ncbi:MAG: alanyl-tRNA editing protein [Bryobacterales bacterium]|nr:alanyl-tRNA editing protein [Bryobacterales bacterium]
MTKRLYYTDSYLREFSAEVLESSPDGLTVYLDQTAFYPASGGQPNDLGKLGGVDVIDVIDEGSRIGHRVAAPIGARAVAGAIDWTRRFDFMRQHTGQHLLSAVLEEMFRFSTISVHFGSEVNTVDLETGSITDDQIREAELRANAIAAENRPVSVTFEQHSMAAGLRKASEREGELRIVGIEGLDRSACGGTHVRSTGEIGAILIRKQDKIRGNVRLEFVCGARAVRRARRDFDALSQIARIFSAPLDDAPALVSSQAGHLRESAKLNRKMGIELAQRRGKELYSACTPDATGRRFHVEQAGALDDEIRTLAQSFTAQPNAAFVATAGNSVLLAVSADSGIHAGNRLKAALLVAQGRGGGNAQLAQGSVPTPEAAAALAESLLRE